MKHIILLLRASLLGLLVFSAPTLRAQTIQWIQLPINTSSSPDTILGPDSSGSNPSGTWIVTNLPCYGNVLITHTFPANVTDFINPADENVPNASGNFVNVETGYGPYSWGQCADLNFLNSSNLPETYTVNFYFLNGPPLNFSVVLSASGLGRYTTATVSQPVVFRGEYDLSSSAYTSLTNQPYNANITAGSTNGGTVGTIVGSYYNIDHSGDNLNTGWALFQPVNDLQTTTLPPGSGAGYPSLSGPVPYLSLAVDQMSGDGIGFSLGYICLTNVCTNGCITIYSPDDITVTTCSNSMPVNFMTTVLDNCCSNCVTLTNYPPSGYDFPLGTTVVTNIATDSLGNTNICTFTVTVIQNTNPPVIFSCPTNIQICIVSNGCGVMYDFTSEVLATNSLGGSVVITQSIPPGTSICSDTDVTFTATDACGDATQTNVPCTLINCSSNCLQILCPSNIVVTTCSNCVPVFYPPATAIDPCCSNGVTLTYYPLSGSCFPLGSTTVTVTAIDGCSNTATCSFTVSVLPCPTTNCIDLVCPADIAVTACGSNCTVVTFAATATDYCCTNGVTLTYNPASGSCFPLGTNVVNVTATDGCGNSNNCSFTVTVSPGTNPPVILSGPTNVTICEGIQAAGAVIVDSDEWDVSDQGFAFEGDGPTYATNTAAYLTDNQTHGTNILIYSDNFSLKNVGGDLTTTLTAAGYSVTHILPPASLPGPSSLSGYAAVYLGGDTLSATDIAELQAYICAGGGVYIAAGTDTITNGAAHGAAVEAAQWNSLINAFGLDMASNYDLVIGALAIPVPLAVTASPVMANLTNIYNNNGNNVSVIAGYPFAQVVATYGSQGIIGVSACTTTGGNCGIMPDLSGQVVVSGGTFIQSIPPGTIICADTNVILTVTNACGESTNLVVPVTLVNCASNCFSVQCPTNKTVQCGSAWTFDPPQATSCCPSNLVTSTGVATNVLVTPISTVTNGSGTCTVLITRTWLITDGCGDSTNCSQTVTVVDTMPPMINCPSNIVVSSCTNVPVFYTPTATNTCNGSNVIVVCNPPSGSIFVSGTTTTVTCVAVDDCGNSNSCSFMVTVEGGCVPPPTNMVLWLPFDETTGPVSANIAPVSGANNGLQVGNPAVVLGAYVDNSLSFNGTQYVSVADYPAIDPGTNQSFTLDAWVNRGTNGPNSPPCVVLDKRDPVTGNGYSLSIDYGHLFITLSGNNYSSGTEVVPADGQWHFIAVTVTPGSPGTGEIYIDGNPPVAFAPTPANLNLVTTAPFIVGMSVYPGNQPWQGGIDEVEMYSRALASNEIYSIYSAGPCGKCKPPCGGLSVICPTNKTVECGSTWTFDPPLATTCCPSNIVTSTGVVTNVLITSISTVTNGVCPRYITNTWLIYDGCGDTDICSQTVTVVDTTPPVVNCPTNSIIVPLNTNCQLVIPAVQISATDNCTQASLLIYSQSPPAGTILSNHTQLVTVTVTDLCGNSNQCQVLVVGHDVTPPTLICPSSLTVSNCLVPCVLDLVTAVDNCCSNLVITQSPPCNTLLGPGINSITVTATDCSGNSTTKVISLNIIGSESFLGSLFNTGVSNSGGLLLQGTVDPHYSLGPVPAGTLGYTAPDAVAVTSLWGWLEINHVSEWIAPTLNYLLNCPSGYYTYTNQFVLPAGADASSASISGRWAADDGGSMYFNGNLLSGNTIPVSGSSGFNHWHPFTINSGFLAYPNMNTILFVVSNSALYNPSPTGLRVEYTNALVNCYTCAPPAIISMTGGGTRPVGASAVFHVNAAGTPPLSYQWYHNGVPVAGNTPNLSIFPLNFADAGMYCVVVSNPCGSVTNCVQLRVVRGWQWWWGWWTIAQLDNPLAATVGPDLILVGTNTFGLGDGSTVDFGLPNPDGQIVNVLDVPPLPSDTSIQIPVIAPPGSNSVPSYSVIMDLYQPDTSTGTVSTLFLNGLNTNEPDGVAVIVDSANNLHLTGSADGTPFDLISSTPLPVDAWSRVALVVDDPQDGVGVNLFLYLNGQPVASTTVLTSTGLPVDWSKSPPTIFSAAPAAPVLNGEFYVSSVQFHAVALTSEQVAGIGSPENGAMPADDPSVGVEPVLSASMSNDVVTLTWTGSPYVLQETTDLASGQWMDSMAPFTESEVNGNIVTTVHPPSPNSPAKFYRLVFRP